MPIGINISEIKTLLIVIFPEENNLFIKGKFMEKGNVLFALQHVLRTVQLVLRTV